MGSGYESGVWLGSTVWTGDMGWERAVGPSLRYGLGSSTWGYGLEVCVVSMDWVRSQLGV